MRDQDGQSGGGDARPERDEFDAIVDEVAGGAGGTGGAGAGGAGSTGGRAGGEREHVIHIVWNATDAIDSPPPPPMKAAESIPPGPIALPGYQRVREIWRGSKTATFEAIREANDQRVVIHVVATGAAFGAERRRRLDDDIRQLARVQHAHVVPILDRGVTGDGLDYFVWRHIDGVTLAVGMGRRSEQTRTAWRPASEQLIASFARVCEAVGAAHARGLVHRGLRPTRIVMDPMGEPFVLCFGLAHAEPAGAQLHEQALPWLSPEQAEAAAGEAAAGDGVTARSDVYALGAMLYQVLTGEPPHEVKGPMHLALDRIARTEPRRPSERIAARSQDAEREGRWLGVLGRTPLSADLEAVVMKAMAKRAGDRYVTAAGLAADLRQYLDGKKPSAAAMTEIDQAKAAVAKMRRRPGVMIGAAAVAVMAIAVIGWLLSGGDALKGFGIDVSHWVSGERPRDAVAVATPDEPDTPDDGAATPDEPLTPDEATPVQPDRPATLDTPEPPVKPVKPTRVGTPPPLPPIEAVARDDRAASLAVLSVGGHVTVMLPGGYRDRVSDPSLLPDGAFKLVGVDLDDNERVTDAQIASLAAAPDLRQLDAMFTGIGDAGLLRLAGLGELRQVNLTGTKVTDAGLAAFARMQRLESVKLNACAITGAGLAHLGGSPGLVSLQLADTPLSDAGAANLMPMTQLHELLLAGTAITDEGAANLAPLSQLAFLTLSGTAIGDGGVKHLGALTGLNFLHVDGTKITSDGLAALAGLGALRQLNLHGCRIGDQGLRHLTTLGSLTLLDVSATQATDEGVAKLRESLANCTIVR